MFASSLMFLQKCCHLFHAENAECDDFSFRLVIFDFVNADESENLSLDSFSLRKVR